MKMIKTGKSYPTIGGGSVIFEQIGYLLYGRIKDNKKHVYLNGGCWAYMTNGEFIGMENDGDFCGHIDWKAFNKRANVSNRRKN